MKYSAVLLLLASSYSQAGFLWDSNYDECIVNQLESMTNKSAIYFIKNACEIKHPFEKDITDLVKNQGIKTEWSVQHGDYISVAIKDNNSKFKITKLVVKVGVYDYKRGDGYTVFSDEFVITFEKHNTFGGARAINRNYGKSTPPPKYDHLEIVKYYGMRVK